MRVIPSFYVVMIDYGRRGLEAVSSPEITRSEVIARIKSGEYQNIAFIQHIDDGMVDDVTDELIDAAELELKDEARSRADRLANTQDHLRKLRAEAV